MTDAALPLVTVAIPCFNHDRYVAASIASVIAQSYPRIELIVIDDGSSDESPARIEALAAECRARFVRFEFRARENRGLCNTLNEALAWAEGEYFVIADSDDVLFPEHTTTLIAAYYGETNVNGVFGGAIVVDADGGRTGVIAPEPRYYTFADLLARDKQMISSSGLLRTDAMRAAGGYLSGLFIEDWYMMLKLTENGARLKTMPAPLVFYRLHATNISKSVQKMLDARLQILDLFSRHEGDGWRKALVHVEGAIDFWRMSKASSIRLLATALKLHPGIAAHPLFRAAVSRIVLPTAITDALKARRDRRQRAA